MRTFMRRTSRRPRRSNGRAHTASPICARPAARPGPRRRPRPGPGGRPAAPRSRPTAPGRPRQPSRLRASGPLRPSGRSVGVDRPDALGRRGAADEAQQAGGHPLGLLGASASVARRARTRRRGRWRSPARRRRGDRRRPPRTGPGGLQRGQRRLERRLGQRGEVGAHHVDRGLAEHVARRRSPSRWRCCQRCRARWRSSASARHAMLLRALATSCGHGAGAQPIGVGQPLDEVGVGDQHVAEPAAGAEQRARGGGPPRASRGTAVASARDRVLARRPGGAGRAGRGRGRATPTASRGAAAGAAASSATSG